MKKLEKKLTKKDLQPIENSTPTFLKMKKKAWKTKLPILKQRFRKKVLPDGPDKQAGQILPVNLRVGDYENQAIPLKLMDHFIDKAGTILIIQCPCRLGNQCKNHNIDLGCVWMGEAAAHIKLKVAKGRYATKEEAKAHARAALKDGLIPSLGKLRGDAVGLNVLDYEHQLMNFCFCCSCCCVVAGMKYGNNDWRKVITRMEGITMETDPEKCVGCGACFKVCIYDGLKLKKGKAVHTDNCIACGRCEMECPNGAISPKFDEDKDIDQVVDEIIERYESIVDISG